MNLFLPWRRVHGTPVHEYKPLHKNEIVRNDVPPVFYLGRVGRHAGHLPRQDTGIRRYSDWSYLRSNLGSGHRFAAVRRFRRRSLLRVAAGLLDPALRRRDFSLPGGQASTFSSIYTLLLIYSLCYMPTLAIANGIGFRHLTDPDRQFPLVRVLGTIGWIVAGLMVGFLGLEDRNIPLQIAAGMSLLLGAYGFMLPHTPPQPSNEPRTVARMLGFDAFALLRKRSFLVLFIASVLISIPLAFYYNFTNLFLNEIGMENAAGKQTLGQQSEVLFMLLMPFLVRRMGIKWMVAVGMLAWTVRYILFAFGNADPATVWMLYAGIVLHGICYDFFFVAGQIYANREAPESLKNSVQAIMTLGTYGVGMFIGSLISGWIVSQYTAADGLKAWDAIWLVPASMAAVVLVLFVIFFKEDKRESTQ